MQATKLSSIGVPVTHFDSHLEKSIRNHENGTTDDIDGLLNWGVPVVYHVPGSSEQRLQEAFPG